MKRIVIFISMGIFFGVIGCKNIFSSDDAKVIKKDGKTFIEDRTGKRWDVTHAEKEYGLKPEKYQFGLGPNAIRPIIQPSMLSPGDLNYPNESSTFVVIGTTINNDTRAYPLSVLNSHEIADEKFGDTHVAVAF